MAALEKGAALIPAIGADAPWSPRVYLLRGLIWTFTGVALTIALFAVGLTAQTHRQSLSAEVLASQARNVSQSLNISIEEARAIVNKDEAARVNQESGMPLALALFGLIPLGVGLAYLVYYRATPPGPQA